MANRLPALVVPGLGDAVLGNPDLGLLIRKQKPNETHDSRQSRKGQRTNRTQTGLARVRCTACATFKTQSGRRPCTQNHIRPFQSDPSPESPHKTSFPTREPAGRRNSIRTSAATASRKPAISGHLFRNVVFSAGSIYTKL